MSVIRAAYRPDQEDRLTKSWRGIQDEEMADALWREVNEEADLSYRSLCLIGNLLTRHRQPHARGQLTSPKGTVYDLGVYVLVVDGFEATDVEPTSTGNIEFAHMKMRALSDSLSNLLENQRF